MRIQRKVMDLAAVTFSVLSWASAQATLQEPSEIRIQNLECSDSVSHSRCLDYLEEAGLKVGQSLSPDQLEELELRLNAHRLIESVELELKKGNSAGDVVVHATIKERLPIASAIQLGWVNPTRPTYLTFDGRIAHLNLTGNQDALTLRVRNDHRLHRVEEPNRSYFLRADYTLSKLFETSFYTRLGFGYRWTIGAVVDWNYEQKKYALTGKEFLSLDTGGWGDVKVGYPILPTLHVDLGARLYGAAQRLALQLSGTWDTVNDVQYPTQGFALQVGAEWAGAEESFSLPDGGSYLLSGPVGALMIAGVGHWEFIHQHVLSARFVAGLNRFEDGIRTLEDDAIGLRYTYFAKRRVESADLKTLGIYFEPGYFLGGKADSGWGARAGISVETAFFHLGAYVLYTTQ